MLIVSSNESRSRTLHVTGMLRFLRSDVVEQHNERSDEQKEKKTVRSSSLFVAAVVMVVVYDDDGGGDCWRQASHLRVEKVLQNEF